jgi:hypothetical protein
MNICKGKILQIFSKEHIQIERKGVNSGGYGRFKMAGYIPGPFKPDIQG